MATIHHFFNRSVIIRRLSTVSGNRKSYVSTGTIDVHLQRIEDIEGTTLFVQGATHKAWADIACGVKEGDTIEDADKIVYSVLAVVEQEKDFAINTHLSIYLKRYGTQN